VNTEGGDVYSPTACTHPGRDVGVETLDLALLVMSEGALRVVEGIQHRLHQPVEAPTSTTTPPDVVLLIMCRE
jgi:hypothetical protein